MVSVSSGLEDGPRPDEKRRCNVTISLERLRRFFTVEARWCCGARPQYFKQPSNTAWAMIERLDKVDSTFDPNDGVSSLAGRESGQTYPLFVAGYVDLLNKFEIW